MHGGSVWTRYCGSEQSTTRSHPDPWFRARRELQQSLGHNVGIPGQVLEWLRQDLDGESIVLVERNLGKRDKE